LAAIEVKGCDRERGQEVAELSVDLALVALLLAAPNLDTRDMCPLDARRGFVEKRTFSEVNGQSSWGTQRREPGLAIGKGTLDSVLQQTQTVISAVGHVVGSFAAGSYRLPTSEGA
jgi:hypothetical protein